MKNPERQALILELRKTSAENNARFWKRIAKELSKSGRNRRTVNLSKIDRCSKDGETVIVPGKVLSMGTVSKRITIVAHAFSAVALAKIKESGSKFLFINELVKKNPKGENVRIIG